DVVAEDAGVGVVDGGAGGGGAVEGAAGRGDGVAERGRGGLAIDHRPGHALALVGGAGPLDEVDRHRVPRADDAGKKARIPEGVRVSLLLQAVLGVVDAARHVHQERELDVDVDGAGGRGDGED